MTASHQDAPIKSGHSSTARGELPAALLRESVELLPMSPSILVDVQHAIDDGVSGAGQLARIIRRDPALVATVLRLINSSFYGLPQPIARPTTAIAYLGSGEIQRLVITASVVNAFNRVDRDALAVFWRHASLTAMIARDLTRRRARWLSPSIAWSLGLLHDIGGLALLAVEPETHGRLMAHREAHQGTVEEAEVALGLPSLTTWGGVICREWRLPAIFEIVATHHRDVALPASVASDDADYLRFVAAGSRLAQLVSAPLREDTRAAVADGVMALLGVDATGLWDALVETHQLRDEAERSVADLLCR